MEPDIYSVDSTSENQLFWCSLPTTQSREIVKQQSHVFIKLLKLPGARKLSRWSWEPQ